MIITILYLMWLLHFLFDIYSDWSVHLMNIVNHFIDIYEEKVKYIYEVKFFLFSDLAFFVIMSIINHVLALVIIVVLSKNYDTSSMLMFHDFFTIHKIELWNSFRLIIPLIKPLVKILIC